VSKLNVSCETLTIRQRRLTPFRDLCRSAKVDYRTVSTAIKNMNFQKTNVLRMANDAGIVENKTTLLHAVKSSAINILLGL